MSNCILAKIGRRDHMESLLRDGVVFMQRLEYYRGLEDNVIGDRNEGVFSRYSGENTTLRVTFRIGDKELVMDGSDVKSLALDSSVTSHAVYCMVGLRWEAEGIDPSTGPILRKDGHSIWWDTRMAEFGDTMVQFTDSPEFKQRLSRAVEDAGYELDQGPLQYVSSDHCGEMGSHRKLEQYQYQGEWRFITTSPVGSPLVLRLGSLEDIAELIILGQS